MELKLLFFCISIQLSTLTFVHSAKLAQLCTFGSNFTVNSTYGSNLNHIYSTITTDTQVDYGFYNVSYGQDSDKVSAMGLCRGDVKPDSCRSCIKNATTELTQLCPTQMAGIVWFDECMLRYSNGSIFGRMQLQPALAMTNVNNVSDASQFNQALVKLLDDLRTQAASGDSLRKVAAGNASATNSLTIYGMAQCTPDLSPLDCNNCLSNVTLSLSQCCGGKQGARILTPSCNIRYESSLFYGPLDDDAPSPASPPLHAPTPPTPLTSTPPPPPPPPPPQLPNLATRKGDYSSISFEVLAMVALFVSLQYLGL